MTSAARILQCNDSKAGRSKDPNNFVRMALLRQRKLEKQRAARLKDKREKIQARGKRESVGVSAEVEGEEEEEQGEEEEQQGDDQVEEEDHEKEEEGK